MRVLVYGNSGSGKSTFAAQTAATHDLLHLDLDSIVWEPPPSVAVERPRALVLDSLRAFLAGHPRWVIEGCYGDLIEAALDHCTELVFLDPGREACLANNHRRPFEPAKYASADAQDAMFEALQVWVAEYYTRSGVASHAYHQRVFDAYPGAKVQYTSARQWPGHARRVNH
jgi:adenylate kinase family enzyme